MNERRVRANERTQKKNRTIELLLNVMCVFWLGFDFKTKKKLLIVKHGDDDEASERTRHVRHAHKNELNDKKGDEEK